MNKECDMEECHDEVYAQFEEKFDDCKQLDDPIASQKCHEEVNAVFQDAFQDKCGPTCWEQAHENFMEALDICATNEDNVERGICENNAKKAFLAHREKCEIGDCYKLMEAQMAFIFE